MRKFLSLLLYSALAFADVVPKEGKMELHLAEGYFRVSPIRTVDEKTKRKYYPSIVFIGDSKTIVRRDSYMRLLGDPDNFLLELVYFDCDGTDVLSMQGYRRGVKLRGGSNHEYYGNAATGRRAMTQIVRHAFPWIAQINGDRPSDDVRFNFCTDTFRQAADKMPYVYRLANLNAARDPNGIFQFKDDGSNNKMNFPITVSWDLKAWDKIAAKLEGTDFDDTPQIKGLRAAIKAAKEMLDRMDFSNSTPGNK